MASFMALQWLKSYLPRSLYGRAALILLVPILALQLVVSIVFIQRHYAGVTEQMSRNVALELRYLLGIVDAATDSEDALTAISGIAEPLAFELGFSSDAPERDVIGLLDFSGRAMIETLREEVPNAQRFDLSANRQVWIWIKTDHGTMAAMFDRRRVSASNPHQLLVLMVFVGLLLTLIAIIFLRNQLRPIRRLARASEAFGKGQVVDYRPAGATEVRAAGSAFLDMRARIERQIEQRTMMLSGVSHDLRTPLTRLKLGLAMGEGDSETDAMLRDVEDMERLLDEFLAFARDDTLDDPVLVDPSEVARTVARKFAGIGASVRFIDVGGTAEVALRPVAVSRAMENLIGNATRYANNCEVSVSVTDRAVRFSVEDDGPGIPKDKRQEAMKPFVRLDSARNQNKGSGVGLGLAITHDIARRHGGVLTLGDSERLGGLKADLVLAR